MNNSTRVYQVYGYFIHNLDDNDEYGGPPLKSFDNIDDAKRYLDSVGWEYEISFISEV